MRLDKSQYSLGTCKTSSHLQKGVLSLTSGRKGIWLHVAFISITKLMLTSSFLQNYNYLLHISEPLPFLFFFPPINPSSSWASPSQNTHSLYNPDVFISLFSLSLPPSLSFCSFPVSLTLFSLFSSPCYIFFSLGDSSGFPVYCTCSVCFFISLLCTLPDASG